MPRSTFSHANFRTGMIGSVNVIELGDRVDTLEDGAINNGIFTNDINLNGNNMLNLGSATSTGIINMKNTIQSTNTSTGALIISGGVAIAKNLHVGGITTLNNFQITGNTILSNTVLTTTTSTGILRITNTTNSTNCTTGSLIVHGGVGICKDVYIKGKLTVEGSSTIINSTTTSVVDPMIKLSSGNTLDVVDMGFYGQYNDGSNKFTGLFRDATDKKWRFYDNLVTEPTAIVPPGISLANLSIGSLELSGSITSSVNITNTTNSTSSTGALVVAGGVAIAKNVNIEGTLYVNDNAESTNGNTGALIVLGGVGIAKNLNVNGNINSAGLFKIDGNAVLETGNNNTFVGIQSTSTTSGISNTFIGANCGTNSNSNNNTFIGKGVDSETTSSGAIAIGINSTGVPAFANVTNGLFFHKSLANVNSGNFVHYDATTGQMGPTNGSLNISSDINSKGDQLNLVGTYNPTSTMYGMDIQGDFLYISDITVPSLRILNIRNKSVPLLLSSTTLSASCKNVNVQGRYVFMPVQSSGVINVLDVTNPSFPTIIDTFVVPSSSGTCSASYISCSCLFVGYGSKLHIIDIKNPNNLSQVSTLTLSGDNRGITGRGNLIYVVTDDSSTTKLYSIDVSNISNPVILQTFTTITDSPNDLEIQGNLLYLATDTTDKLHIIDISNPASMSIVSSTSISSPMSIYLQGDYIYVVSSGSTTVGLSVYDISIPTSVTLVTNTNPGSTLGNNSDVIGSGKYIYTTQVNQQNLKIYNIEGSSFQAMQVGGLEVNQLHVKENLILDNNLYVSGGLSLGNGFVSHNDSAINGTLTTTNLKLNSTSTDNGTITLSVANDDVVNYTLTLPRTQGSNNQTLINNGSGILTWGTVSGSDPTAVTAGNSFGTDNRMLRTFGTGNAIESTGITISNTNGISGVTDLTVGSLKVDGKTILKVRTVTTSTSLDDDYILNVNSTGTATITLPDVTNANYIGVTYLVINQSTNSVIIDTFGSNKIVDSGADVDDITLSGSSGERLQIVGNGSKWYVI